MHYRRFGKTELQLSVFSLGTMRYLASEEMAYHTIVAAINQGINHLETARGYGDSEKFLGAALRRGLPVPRSQLCITTKALLTADPDQMARTIDESLAQLGLDYVDTLALHGLNTWEHLEWVKSDRGCMEPVRQAVAEGRVRHVGFSTHGPLEVIMAAIATDFFEFVNLHYTYFFQRNAAAVELAHQKDMGVFLISPADKGGLLYTPSDRLEQLCQPFSPLELNYRFVLSDPRIHTLSVGPANPGELTWPLSVSDRTHPLTAEELEVFDRLENQHQQALGSDRCSQCYACLPCPVEINIPKVLRLRNLAVAYDMTQFGQYRYEMLENGGHWVPGNKGSRCTDCGDCLPRCPEKLDIPKLLRDTHQRLSGKPRRRLWEE